MTTLPGPEVDIARMPYESFRALDNALGAAVNAVAWRLVQEVACSHTLDEGDTCYRCVLVEALNAEQELFHRRFPTMRRRSDHPLPVRHRGGKLRCCDSCGGDLEADDRRAPVNEANTEHVACAQAEEDRAVPTDEGRS